MTGKELLRRIDEKDYLTEREHREFLEELNKDLEVLEEIKKNHPDLYNLYKKMKEAESEWRKNGKKSIY